MAPMPLEGNVAVQSIAIVVGRSRFMKLLHGPDGKGHAKLVVLRTSTNLLALAFSRGVIWVVSGQRPVVSGQLALKQRMRRPGRTASSVSVFFVLGGGQLGSDCWHSTKVVCGMTQRVRGPTAWDPGI